MFPTIGESKNSDISESAILHLETGQITTYLYPVQGAVAEDAVVYPAFDPTPYIQAIVAGIECGSSDLTRTHVFDEHTALLTLSGSSI